MTTPIGQFDDIAQRYSDAVTASGAIAQDWKVESVNGPELIAAHAHGTGATGRFNPQKQLLTNDLAWEVAA